MEIFFQDIFSSHLSPLSSMVSSLAPPLLPKRSSVVIEEIKDDKPQDWLRTRISSYVPVDSSKLSLAVGGNSFILSGIREGNLFFIPSPKLSEDSIESSETIDLMDCLPPRSQRSPYPREAPFALLQKGDQLCLASCERLRLGDCSYYYVNAGHFFTSSEGKGSLLITIDGKISAYFIPFSLDSRCCVLSDVTTMIPILG
jgi:hypothetical protein